MPGTAGRSRQGEGKRKMEAAKAAKSRLQSPGNEAVKTKAATQRGNNEVACGLVLGRTMTQGRYDMAGRLAWTLRNGGGGGGM